MPLKSKTLKSLSGSENNPQSWGDLTKSEKSRARETIELIVFPAAALAVSFAVAAYEIKNTPEGCTAVIFPEQTFIKQPEHCHRARHNRSITGLGF